MQRILYHLTFSICFVLAAASLAAQSSFFTNEKQRQNGIEVRVGWHVHQLQDQVYSPLIYRGSSFQNISLQYERHQKRGIHQLSITLDQSEITAAELITFSDYGQYFTRMPSETSQISIHYGYTHRISSTEQFQWYLGAIVESQINHTTYNFGLSDREGYLFSNALQPWLSGEYQLNAKNRLCLDFIFPLLSYLSRPRYAIVDNEEIQHTGSDLAYLLKKGEWVSLDTYQALDFFLSWDRRLSDTAAIQFGYGLEFSRYSEPLSISILKNSFNLGFSFIF